MEKVKRDQLLARIHADRTRFDEVVARVPPEHLTEPILPGGWSVKDVLAHLAWSEREPVTVLRAGDMAASSELWDLTEDERNRAVVESSRSQNLDEVPAEYSAAFADYVAALGDASNIELNDPARLKG